MGPLSAVKDPQFQKDVLNGLINTTGYGVASVVGGPADLASVIGLQLNKGENPIYGSEWLLGKMQEYGIVGPERNPVAEVLASGLAPLSVPGVLKGIKAGRAMELAKEAKAAEEHAKLKELLDKIKKTKL